MRSSLLKVTTGALAVGLLAAGCGDAPTSNDAAGPEGYPETIELSDSFDPDGHFSFAYHAFPSSWDPTKSVTTGDSVFYEPMYDRLLQEDINGHVQPMLAEEFTPSEDNKTLTLKIREGVTFSDGTPLDAEAVKFNLDRNRAEGSLINGEIYQIESVEVTGEYTVDLHLSGGIGALVVGLAGRGGTIISPTAAQNGVLEDKPVGVGPYVATEISPGSEVDFELTENYWDPEAQNVATMTFVSMPDDQTRLNALQSGELDGAGLNPDQLGAAADRDINVISKPGSKFVYFMVNAGMEPFDNPEVRKALNMALDREGIAQGLYEGNCTPQIQPFPETSPGYSDKIGDGSDVFPYDPEAAKQILEENGVTDLHVATAAVNITIYTKFAEVIQDELADVGIDLEIHSVPPAAQVAEFATDKVTETYTSVGGGINDPDSIMGRYLAPNALFNPGEVEYTELLELSAEGSASLDPAVRKPIYEKFMDAWVANPPHMIPICMVHGAAGFGDNVSGVEQLPNGSTNLRGVAVGKE